MARGSSRREFMKLGGAGLAGASVYKGLESLGIPLLSAAPEKQRDDMSRSLGRYIYLTPQKLGGGTHAVDMDAHKTLAWISYWNYGDTCPISHHVSAYPADSGDPYKGFEFVNSTQGGENILIYGIPTRIKQMGLLERTGEGNHIYRVGFDGKQMELLEDISETTGIGLGVHTNIYPDANGFASADGQKDVAAFFTRARGKEKTKAQMAFRGDWAPKANNLADAWVKGGTLRITRLVEPPETRKYEYEGTTGNKINWEMAPMAELLVERGQIVGDSPGTLCGLDAVVHHPNNRWSAFVLRMCGAALIIDRKNWEPVACLHVPENSPGNLPVKKVSSGPDVWEIKFEDVKCPGHESGFKPDGTIFTMMANLRQNHMPIFDTSDPDPRKWKKVAFVKDPSWVGEFPSPFHLCFSMDQSKMFVSVLKPKPARSDVVVVDTKTWKIIKKFPNIGLDCQTMAVTYDGKYVLQIFSGFQRLESGLFVFRQDTLEPVGYEPNFGGHHDCVIVPSKAEELLNSRCTTL